MEAVAAVVVEVEVAMEDLGLAVALLWFEVAAILDCLNPALTLASASI